MVSDWHYECKMHVSLKGLNRNCLEEREILAKLQMLSKFTFFHSNSCSTPILWRYRFCSLSSTCLAQAELSGREKQVGVLYLPGWRSSPWSISFLRAESRLLPYTHWPIAATLPSKAHLLCHSNQVYIGSLIYSKTRVRKSLTHQWPQRSQAREEEREAARYQTDQLTWKPAENSQFLHATLVRPSHTTHIQPQYDQCTSPKKNYIQPARYRIPDTRLTSSPANQQNIVRFYLPPSYDLHTTHKGPIYDPLTTHKQLTY